MSISSDDLDNIPEECSNEEDLQIQLNNEIYISDIDDDNIEIEQNEEEIIQGLQDLSFEEAVAINEDDLDKNLELTQKIKFYGRVKSDVWKYVDEETCKYSQCPIQFKPTTATTSISEIQAEKTQAIFEWIILALKPFKVIEEKAFRNMIHNLDPFYKISSLALAADFWTSLKMESSHIGESIADKVYSSLEEFKIETKFIALTTDNGSNMISKLILNDFCHYRCIAHILNLIVLAGLNLIEVPIKKLRKLIKTICKSPKIFEDLKNIIILNGKSFLAPTLDCKTRWNSTYHMVKRA
ncbi:2330_t:CDS:2, partial [Gigaspora margarita]